MVKEIKIRRDGVGVYYITNPEEIPKNWYLYIDNSSRKIVIIPLSRAGKENKPAYENLQEGSLFLVNRTYQCYYYFREKNKQAFFERYNLEKVKNIKGEIINILTNKKRGEIVDPVIAVQGYHQVTEGTVIESAEKELICANYVRDDDKSDYRFIIQKTESGRLIIYLDEKQSLSSISEILDQLLIKDK